MPPQARHVRGGLSIRLSERDIAFIAEHIMPDELAMDSMCESIKVTDASVLTENLCNALNDDTTNDRGGTLISSMLERGLTHVFEQGDEGIDVIEHDVA
jgi:hypothetical protein